MHIAYLAIGSNIGNRSINIKKAFECLSCKLNILRYASVYESKAVGFEDQDNFLNTAISVETKLEPVELLKFIKEIEKQIGRKERFRWGPREIDIDVIFYDELIYKDSLLEIPHKLASERDFVLQPMNDIAPFFMHPIFKKSVKKLLQELSISKKSILSKVEI